MLLKAFVKLNFKKTIAWSFTAAILLQISGQSKIKRIKILCRCYYVVNKFSYLSECIFISLPDHYICSRSLKGFYPREEGRKLKK